MKPIKTGLCSFGMSGRVFHAPFLRVNPGFELYSVWERNKNLAAASYPSIKTCRSLEELLNDEAVELIVVNTPNYTHFDYARQALLAGKHVVVEKPFAITVAEATEITELAEKLGKKITVYQNRRYDSDYKTVKKVLEEHWLGDIVEAEIHFDRYSETLSPKLHKETPGPGTGLLYDLGSHLIDQALQLFGMPDSVFADITIIRPISKVEDYMEILLYYTGLRVRIKSSYLVREALPAYILHGSIGSFIKPRADVQEQELLAGARPGGEDWGKEPEENDKWIKGLLHTEKDGKIIREYIPSLKGNYGAFYDGLYESIRNDRPLPVSPRDGINTLRIIEASYESKRQKKIISL